MSGDGAGWRAARTASLITAVALFLLLARSEIRRTLLASAVAVPLIATAVWLASFVVVWRRHRTGGGRG